MTDLCCFHFRVVYDEFATGMSKPERIRRLIDYCTGHDQIEELLQHVQAENPRQYEKHVAVLKKQAE